MGVLAAIAAFFTGAVHVAPTSVPVESTSTVVVSQNFDNGSSYTPTAQEIADNKAFHDASGKAKEVPANYVSPIDYSKLPTNKSTESSGPSDVNPDSETPYIGSIYPNSAPVGTTLNITGSNLTGFEGDVYFFFERADGKVVRISGKVTTHTSGDAIGAQNATLVLKEPCEPGQTVYGDYSGIPSTCDYVQLTPGNYKVYTTPWSKTSNVIDFTVIPSLSIPPSATAPTSCIPNWQCGWNECNGGYQGMSVVDLNNCGVVHSGPPLACPALAKMCR